MRLWVEARSNSKSSNCVRASVAFGQTTEKERSASRAHLDGERARAPRHRHVEVVARKRGEAVRCQHREHRRAGPRQPHERGVGAGLEGAAEDEH